MNESFKALADPTRRQILRLLREQDRTAGEIAEYFNMTITLCSGVVCKVR